MLVRLPVHGGPIPTLSVWFNHVWHEPITALAIESHLVLIGGLEGRSFLPVLADHRGSLAKWFSILSRKARNVLLIGAFLLHAIPPVAGIHLFYRQFPLWLIVLSSVTVTLPLSRVCRFFVERSSISLGRLFANRPGRDVKMRSELSLTSK